MTRAHNSSFTHWSTASMFILSMVVIGLQLSLIRSMSVLRYYHFSYLVISTALLGFGASGTFLTFAYRYMKSHAEYWVTLLFGGLILTIPTSYLIATSIPLDVRFVFYSNTQLGYLLLYNVLMFIPFFLGASIIGFLLTYYKERIPTLYGANLIGSGAGALFAVGLMYLIPSIRLPLIVGSLSFIAMLCWLIQSVNSTRMRVWRGSIVWLSLLITGGVLVYNPEVSVDPYKAFQHFKELEKQGDAEHVLSTFGPRGRIDIFDSKTIHHTLFAGIEADTVPPDQMAVLLDGQMAAYMFKADDGEEVGILDYVPQSLPYRLVRAPKVLLLGEISGVNIWLARRFGAKHITLVQTNPSLLEIMADSLRRENGGIFHSDSVELVSKDPRLFLEQTRERYDIIQFVQAEAQPAAGGGLGGLHEDYTLTVEGLQAARNRLTDRGMLSLTRGMQSPARDNIKVFGLMVQCLPDSTGAEGSLFQSRNYLAVHNMLTKKPATDSFIRRYYHETSQLGMDVECAGGARPDSVEMKNIIDGPESGNGSWYGAAVQALTSDRRDTFYNHYLYNVRPPTDQRPYFYDFFKWSSLPQFVEQYGRYWFRKIELGYAILALTFIELTVVGFILILLPLILLRSDFRSLSGIVPVFLYFGALGIGFMFLEMVYIQQFTKFMGDPVFSVSAALLAILVSSGLGSSIQSFLPGSPGGRIRTAGAAIVVIALVYLFQLNGILNIFVEASTEIRFLVTVLLLFPISFFMGWMFPNGMHLLGTDRDRLVPWAWGVNGFLSVAASPLAVMVSMSAGFNITVSLAVGCYVLAVVTTYYWKAAL